MKEYIKPTLQFQLDTGVSEIKIVNQSANNRTFQIGALPPSGLSVYVDNNSAIIQEMNQGYNLYKGFNLNFFRLVQGDNALVMTGDGVMTMTGRLLYNVAG